jgi:pyruvate dehydrogenase E1 component alpha subunit
MHITDPSSGLMVTTGIVGGGLPIAVGLALASAMRRTSQVTVVNFGDGATNIGAFHEAMNLASLWQVPLVFVCQNNHYAEYTPFAGGTAVDRVADRGASYRMRSYRVDGNVPEEMYVAAREAVDAARSGGGPSLIEAMTYRFFGHSMGDSMAYMPRDELEAARNDDPVLRLRSRLIELGTCDEGKLESEEASILLEVEDALEFAMASPPPDLSELTTDVYGEEVAV